MKSIVPPLWALTGVLLCLAPAAIGQRTKFTADLSGKNEVPPVNTTAAGKATFQLSKDGSSLSYTLSVSNISDVIMAHIHVGEPGTRGDHVAPLYPVGMTGSMDDMSGNSGGKPDEMTSPKKVSGVIASGTIHASDLVGPLQGKKIADLVAEIRADKAYVNVHTKAHSDGEIRGPIK